MSAALIREIARLQTLCDEQAKRIRELQAAGTELVQARREAERERDEARCRAAFLEEMYGGVLLT